MVNHGAFNLTGTFSGAGYVSSFTGLAASAVCSTTSLLGTAGTAVCQVGTTADGAVAGNIQNNKECWTSTGTKITGSLNPTASTICSGTSIAGVNGSATCVSFPVVGITGNLSWGSTTSQQAKTLTFSITTTGSNFVKLSFTGTGSGSFIISEINGKSVSQLASASDVVLGLTSNGQTSATVKIKPAYAGGAAQTMTVTATDANGTSQTILADATITGPTLTDLALWLSADRGVTYDGSNFVSQWDDQSGNGRHATQGTGSQQPLYIASGLNNEPTIRFDGSNDSLSVSGGSFLVKQVFFVFKSITTNFNNYYAILGTPNWGDRPFLFETGGKIFHFNFFPSSVRKNKNGLTSPFSLDPITSFMAVTVNTASPNTSRSYTVGLAETTYFGNFEVAEILAYSAVLADADRDDVEDYLIGKYGL